MAELSLDDLIRLNAVAERFEASWRQGRRPSLERFLQSVPPSLRDALLEDLLGIEIELRRKFGFPVNRTEYEHRFSDRLEIVAAAFAEPQALEDETEMTLGGSASPLP